MTSADGQAAHARSPDWQGLETLLGELNSRVSALKESWPEHSSASVPSPAARAPLKSAAAATTAAEVCTALRATSSTSELPRPSLPFSPPAASPDKPLNKVPSIFAGGGEKDQRLLSRLYGLNIFAWEKNGGEGVDDDVSGLQLRCAARLRIRERELKERDLEGIRQLQRAEMNAADAFLEAFDRKEFGVEQSRPCNPGRIARSGGGAGPLPVAGLVTGWPHPHSSLLPAQTRGADRYLDELLTASPEGCAAAVRSLSASGYRAARLANRMPVVF